VPLGRDFRDVGTVAQQRSAWLRRGSRSDCSDPPNPGCCTRMGNGTGSREAVAFAARLGRSFRGGAEPAVCVRVVQQAVATRCRPDLGGAVEGLHHARCRTPRRRTRWRTDRSRIRCSVNVVTRIGRKQFVTRHSECEVGWDAHRCDNADVEESLRSVPAILTPKPAPASEMDIEVGDGGAGELLRNRGSFAVPGKRTVRGASWGRSRTSSAAERAQHHEVGVGGEVVTVSAR